MALEAITHTDTTLPYSDPPQRLLGPFKALLRALWSIMTATQAVTCETKLDSDLGTLLIEAKANVSVDIPDMKYNIKPSVDYFNITDVNITNLQLMIVDNIYDMNMKDLCVEDQSSIYIAAEATILDTIEQRLQHVI